MTSSSNLSSFLGRDREQAGPQAQQPVFVVGTGRCGSTLINSVLSMHPAFAWVSSWTSRFPNAPFLSVINRVWDWPLMDRFRETRLFPTPTEPYDTFAALMRDFRSEQVDGETVQEARQTLVPYIDSVRRYHGKPRYLAKMVGRPVKIALFGRLFPDGCFVHVSRGLRPTLASLLRVPFYKGWGSLDQWRWDEVPAEYVSFYEEMDCAEEIGVAITLKLNLDAVRRQAGQLDPLRWIEVPYAEFVKDPVRELRRLGERLGLTMDERYIQRVGKFSIYPGADEKWRNYFDQAQIARLDEFEGRFGY